MWARYISGTDKGFVKALHTAGFDIKTGHGRRKVHGPSYLNKAWNLDGKNSDGETMQKALFAIKDAWKDTAQVTGYMTLGIALVYHAQKPKAVDGQVRTILKRNSPEENTRRPP